MINARPSRILVTRICSEVVSRPVENDFGIAQLKKQITVKFINMQQQIDSLQEQSIEIKDQNKMQLEITSLGFNEVHNQMT